MSGDVSVSVGMWLRSSSQFSSLCEAGRAAVLSRPALRSHSHVRVCLVKALVAIS